jgi:[ribosomal protein S18]-alanine N-acetyltransferase
VNFAVRNYQPADFLALWSIDQSCFPPGIAYSRDELHWFIRKKGAFTLVAERSWGKLSSSKSARPTQNRPDRVSETAPSILGFLVADAGAAQGHVVTIDVISDARGNGIGSALLDLAEKELRLRRCRAVRLETAVDNLAALTFYKKHGYLVTRLVPRYYSNGLDALILEKVLPSLGRSDTLLK